MTSLTNVLLTTLRTGVMLLQDKRKAFSPLGMINSSILLYARNGYYRYLSFRGSGTLIDCGFSFECATDCVFEISAINQ